MYMGGLSILWGGLDNPLETMRLETDMKEE